MEDAEKRRANVGIGPYNIIMRKTAGRRRGEPACDRKICYFAVVTSVTVFAMVENTL